MKQCLFFEEEKDETKNTKRKGENKRFLTIPAWLSLRHRPTVPVVRRDVRLRTLLKIRCPAAVATDINNTNKGY